MEYPIKLPPLAVIKAKALEALEAGQLQCQKPDFVPGIDSCLYNGPCAIGVALDESARNRLDGEISPDIGTVTSEGLVVVDAAGDEDALISIQCAHDLGDIVRLRALLTA